MLTISYRDSPYGVVLSVSKSCDGPRHGGETHHVSCDEQQCGGCSSCHGGGHALCSGCDGS